MIFTDGEEMLRFAIGITKSVSACCGTSGNGIVSAAVDAFTAEIFPLDSGVGCSEIRVGSVVHRSSISNP